MKSISVFVTPKTLADKMGCDESLAKSFWDDYKYGAGYMCPKKDFPEMLRLARLDGRFPVSIKYRGTALEGLERSNYTLSLARKTMEVINARRGDIPASRFIEALIVEKYKEDFNEGRKE